MEKQNSFSKLGFVIWLIGAIFFLYEFFLRTFLGAVASQVIPDLHLQASDFAFIASCFYISYGLMQVPVGAITDKLGIKLSMLLATILCCLSALYFSVAHSFISALIARLLMGVGGAFAFICLLVITMTWFDKKYFALLAGSSQFLGTMGALLAGGPLAAVVTELNVPWRTVFIYISVFGGFLALLTLLFVKEKKNNNAERLVILRQEKTLFLKMLSLFKTSQAWYTSIYSASVFLSIAMLGAVWGTIYLQSIGLSQALAATIISGAWLGFAVGCPVLGGISDHFVRRKPVMIFCAILGFAVISAVIYIHSVNFWFYAVLFFLLGFSGAGQNVGFAIITEHVDSEQKALALGLNSAVITLLAAAMPMIVGYFIEHTAGVSVAQSDYVPKDFFWGFSLMPILYLIAILLSIFFIDETYCKPQKEVIFLENPLN